MLTLFAKVPGRAAGQAAVPHCNRLDGITGRNMERSDGALWLSRTVTVTVTQQRRIDSLCVLQ